MLCANPIFKMLQDVPVSYTFNLSTSFEYLLEGVTTVLEDSSANNEAFGQGKRSSGDGLALGW